VPRNNRRQVKIFLLLFYLQVNAFLIHAQDDFKGLIAHTYAESKCFSDLIDVKKTISIAYNDTYCQVYHHGKVYNFKNLSYVKKITNSGVVETITTAENIEFQAGWFTISIHYNFDKTNSINIDLPLEKCGHFYYASALDTFSEKDTLIYAAYIKAWKNFYTEANKQNENILSKQKYNPLKEKLQKTKDSVIAAKLDSAFMKGDNYNQQQIRWLSDTVASKIKLSKGEQFYKNFKLLIDDKGVVTKVISLSEQDQMLEKYMPTINYIILGSQLTPYLAINGKHYPSYKTLYIRLYPED